MSITVLSIWQVFIMIKAVQLLQLMLVLILVIFHHRQPLLLEGLNILNWIEEKQLMTSNLSDKIKFYPVSKYVNYPSNNDAECIKKLYNYK